MLDFAGGVLAFGNQHLPEPNRLRPADVTQWDLFALFRSDRVARITRAHCGTEAFWESLEPVPGAKEGVARLREDGHEVVVVTSPWEACRGWEYIRRGALARHFQVGARDVVVTDRKELVTGDAFLDDKPEHVRAWMKRHPQGTARLFAMHHNEAAHMEGLPSTRWEYTGELLASLANSDAVARP